MRRPDSNFLGCGAAALCLTVLTGLSSASHDGYYDKLSDNCPSKCQVAGPNPAKWTHIYTLKVLEMCQEPIIFDLGTQSDVGDLSGMSAIRACSSVGNETTSSETEGLSSQVDGDNSERHAAQDVSFTSVSSCGAKAVDLSVTPETAPVQKTDVTPSEQDILLATYHLSQFLIKHSGCDDTVFFAKSGSAVVGMYLGAQVAKASVSALSEAFSKAPNGGGGNMFQVCGPSRSSLMFGAFATSLSDLPAVQSAVSDWNSRRCMEVHDHQLPPLRILTFVSKDDQANNTGSMIMAPTRAPREVLSLEARSTCKTQDVMPGDTCAGLASRCHITIEEFSEYNPQHGLCSTLVKTRQVCCSAGKLPDPKAKPETGEICRSHTIGASETCQTIATTNSIKQSDIESFNNNKTWGWTGCDSLQPGLAICVSKGYPPMPVPVPGAVCGPIKPGSERPSNDTDLASLNPCPLKACCNAKGVCGTSHDFCMGAPAKTGAPGAVKPGSGSCVLNCGTTIVESPKAPASFMRVGYFDSANINNRSCLTMNALHMPTKGYTHIHFAYVYVTPQHDVEIPPEGNVEDQYGQFIHTEGFQKIVSFGAWASSHSNGTIQRLRDATKPENQAKFIENLVMFMDRHKIDGYDFNWEQPDSYDFPGASPSTEEETQNYLSFLMRLRSLLPRKSSISVVLPASYEYLKPYHVTKMLPVINYYVYMTYDLHGQWDSNYKWSVPDCPAGNCLRSHINVTETAHSLAMITKAGVPTTKIVVGITSYGRSFRMTNSTCSDAHCTFKGVPGKSQANKGRCTGTAGLISNAEIEEIFSDNWKKYPTMRTWVDEASSSTILVYGKDGAVDWVAYMDDYVKASRIHWIKGQKFAGTSDWALDLQLFNGDDGHHNVGYQLKNNNACPKHLDPADLEKLSKLKGKMPDNCMAMFALDSLHGMLGDVVKEFNEVSKGYDNLFGYYAQWFKDGINPQLKTFMKFGSGEGNKYFHCRWEIGLKQLENQDKGEGPCTKMPHFWDNDETADVWYTLSDADGFYRTIRDKMGIEKEWVKFDKRQGKDPCFMKRQYANSTLQHKKPALANNGTLLPQRPYASNGTLPHKPYANNGTLPPLGGVSRVCKDVPETQHDVPVKIDSDKITIGNPKDLIMASMHNITALTSSILASYMSVGLNMYTNDKPGARPLDAVEAYSMPVFQLLAAVDSMKEIKKIGEEYKKEKQKELIFTILSVLFMVIPFAGPVAEATIGDAAMLARTALLLGEAGNGALSVAGIIADPRSAPFAILGLIVGAESIRVSKVDALERAAQARREMKNSDIEKFPQVFRDKDAIVQKIVKRTEGCPVGKGKRERELKE